VAVIAVVFGRYLAEVVPALAGYEVASAAVAVVLAGGLNVIGVRENAWSQRVLSAVKVASIAALCVAALTAGAAETPAAREVQSAGADPTGTLRLALVGILWTYSGWSDVTLVSGELRDPARNLGRTVVLGTGVLVALYALVQVAVTHLLPAGGAASSERVLSDAVAVAFGDGAARVVALLVVVSTFGAINGTTLAVSRLGYAMALDGTVWRGLGAVHPRLGTPTRSIAAVVIASLAYVLTSEFRSLLELFTFSVWFFYGLTAVALFVLRRRGAGAPLAWRAPGGPIAPLVVLGTFVFMTASLFTDPEQIGTAALGAFLIAATVPIYLVWRRLRASGAV
jgi:APA family basic amino acid/polyamine antiporter